MVDREQYKQKIHAQVRELQAEIEKLKARAQDLTDDAHVDANEVIRDLEAKAHVATAKLEELSDASVDSWGSVKKGVESAYHSLRTAFRDAVSKFQSRPKKVPAKRRHA